MNRSIMIVICDFVVLSMMSMFSGGPGSGGASAGAAVSGGGNIIDDRAAMLIVETLRTQERQLEEMRQRLLASGDQSHLKEIGDVRRELAQVRARKEYLEEKLALKITEAGELSPDELQRQIQREVRRRMVLRGQYEEAQHRVDMLSRELALTREYSQSAASRSEKDLEFERRNVAAKEREIRAAQEQMAKIREDLSARDNSLRTLNAQLEKATLTNQENAITIKTYESELAFARGRMSAIERDLAESRSANERNARLLKSKDIELNERKRQMEEMQKVVRRAVTELAQTKKELSESRGREHSAEVKLAGSRSDLAAKNAELQRIAEQNKNDVFERYSQSVMTLTCHIREERFLSDNDYRGTFYLPVIKIQGKKYLAGSFRQIFGGYNNLLTYRKIRLFNLLTGNPADKKSGKYFGGAVYLPENAPGIVLFELPENPQTKQVLPVIGLDALRRYNVQELYLFGSGSFGKESCALGTRASLNFASNDPALYIRNSNSPSEVKARVGDFVLTRTGEFVGVVTAVTRSGMNRKEEARCTLFPAALKMKRLEAGSADAEGYFTAFGNALKKMMENND